MMPITFQDGKDSRSEDGFLLLTIATFFLIGCLAQWQDDTWWLLRTGSEIWHTWEIPKFDSLSFASESNMPLQLHEWLSSLVLFLLFDSGGYAGVQLFCSLCLGVTSLLLALWLPGSSKLRAYTLLSTLPFFVLTLSARPQLIANVFLAATLLVLQRRRVYFLPPILFLWAQCHASAVLGLAYSLVTLGLVVLFDNSQLKKNFIIGCCCILATTFNPLGWNLFSFVFQSTERLNQLHLQEWEALSFNSVIGIYIPFLILIPFMFFRPKISNIARTPETLTCALFCALLFFLSVMHVRYLTLWGMFYAGFIGNILSSSQTSSIELRVHQQLRSLFIVLFPLYFVCISTFCGKVLSWYPLDTNGIDALRSTPQPRFTTYNTGGFALWFDPNSKSFIDSRQDPFSLEFLKEVLSAQRTGDLQSLFEKWRFRSAIVETGSPSFFFLRHSGWNLSWHNDQLSIFAAQQNDK